MSNHSQIKKQFLLLLVIALLASAYIIINDRTSEPSSRTEVSYADDVLPILESRCGQCHMGEFVSAGLNMETYASLMTGSQNGPVILPGNAADSLLIQKLVAGEMPRRGPRLPPDQLQLIRDWIDAGALNN